MDPLERLVREGRSGLLSAEGEHGVQGTGWSGSQALGSGSCPGCAVGKEGGYALWCQDGGE